MSDDKRDDHFEINPYSRNRKRGRGGVPGWVFVVGFVVAALLLYVVFILIALAFGQNPASYLD